MNISLKRDAGTHTILHQWEARTKLIAFLILIFTFSSIREFFLLPVMAMITAVLFLLSAIPVSYLVKRMRLPGLFVVIMAGLLLFMTKGSIWMDVGPVSITREGVLAFALISTRFICIITLTIVLFGTTPFLTIIKALKALRMPDILVDITLFAYRYLFEIRDQYAAMQTAMNLRGLPQKGMRGLQARAALIGTMLIRSFDQSNRVYQAMMLRGYGQAAVDTSDFRTRLRDWLWLNVFLIISALLIAAQLFI